jgi:exodeoxyribonuclease VII small subunit
MAKKKPTTDCDEPTTFEAALAELEAVVADLEHGELGLEESLKRYEVGIRRIRQCQEQLQRAERRIALLSGVDADGKPITQPFDDAEFDSLEEKADNRGKRRGAKRTVSDDDVDDGRSLF